MAVVVEDRIANLDLAHRRPARRCRHGRVECEGTSNLCALHEYRSLDGGRGRKAIHDFAQVRSALGPPMSWLCRGTLGESAILVGPLGNGEQRVWTCSRRRRSAVY